MKKAYGYVRVSSDRQEQEGFSIPAQKRLIREYAKNQGIKLVKIFEEAQSAKSAGRHEFLKMVEAVSKGDANTILVEKTDRLYRNIEDTLLISPERIDIEIHFIKESEILSKDSSSSQKLVRGFRNLMAKFYVDNLSEEVKKGSREKASQGWFPGPAPIGYINQDKIIKVDPKKGHLVARAFELAASGQYSLARLSQELFDMGLRSKRANKKLSKSRLKGLLQNCFYYGSFTYGGVQYNNAKHEPLIS